MNRFFAYSVNKIFHKPLIVSNLWKSFTSRFENYIVFGIMLLLLSTLCFCCALLNLRE
jgi:hypothetical protein